MSTDNQTKNPVETELESEVRTFTLEDIARAMMEFDICMLNTPVQFGGMELNCAKRVRKALVKDRIEAVRFTKEQYGFESNDAITAHIASSILVFGERIEEKRDEHGKLTNLGMKGEVVIPVDMLINLPYEEHINLAHLMGKS
ncbi:conserved hypothetical protein [Vibrio crassostreae]|jgi:hypothetical protein|uniref:hypothetical protein n=1 Tax=Vibrio crassostreae TaxID=246167 RepID=UPI001044BC68|nr:hypothetical protein [Vibrio crassostreae]TCL30442.1 hypothetical protein EDB52_101729 [Vibrio crassostreae]CAK1709091.1 conserved hypothetical protein [Vibrio crassostreae]CAK1710259.1 conserved hypothetical protein [Vibrio crassostreae]CAK1720302.1 conserved hypothetical protein [Vibrio crassostreae]CAK1720659.1 conserved hypothetical protein [Vibrio crassostreae]